MEVYDYRVLELEVNNEMVITRPFDYGCTAIVQDIVTSFSKRPQGVSDPTEMFNTLVYAVLFRMLEGKITSFHLIHNKLSPELVVLFYHQFKKWYEMDVDSLNNMMGSLKQLSDSLPSNSRGNASDEFDSSFYSIAISLFEHHNVDLERVLEWKFETVALFLYTAERKRLKEAWNNLTKGSI